MSSKGRRHGHTAIAWIALGSVAIAALGCGIIRPTRGRHFEEAQHSGFLGDYSQLAPREGFDCVDCVFLGDVAPQEKQVVFREGAREGEDARLVARRHVAERDKLEIEDRSLLALARASEGSMRDALSLMDQVVAF